MNKEWQEQLANKRQNLIREFHQTNDNPLDEIYPQRRISEIRESNNKLFKSLKDEINRYESALSEILTVVDHYEGDVINKVYEIATNNLRNTD